MLKFLLFFCMWLIHVKGQQSWHTSQVTLIKLYNLQNEQLTVINNYLELETKRLEKLKT